jgi:hypothetical protein
MFTSEHATGLIVPQCPASMLAVTSMPVLEAEIAEVAALSGSLKCATVTRDPWKSTFKCCNRLIHELLKAGG